MTKGFPYQSHPTGWYVIAFTDELKPGTTKKVRLCSEDMVLYRGESGSVYGLDAYCRHNGANLAKGKVWADDIVCAFHAWRWDCEGRNVDIPYSRILHNKAKLKTWTLRERSGVIWAWYDALGEEPYWEPLSLPEDGVEHYPIAPYATHIQDLGWEPQLFTENLADPAHGKYVHRAPIVPDDVQYAWNGPEWSSSSEIEFGPEFVAVSGAIRGNISTVGQGVGIVRTVFSYQKSVAVVLITPVDHGRTDLRLVSYLTRVEGADEPNEQTLMGLRKRNENIMLDFPLFDDCIYLDGPIWPPEESRQWNMLRQWLKQFYPADTGIRSVEAGTLEPVSFPRQDDSIVGGRRHRDRKPERVVHAKA